MAETPKQLRTLRQDFSRGGYFAEAHSYYRLLFQFLRLSPSYELARRYRMTAGKLSKEDRQRLPKDFDRVLEVFDDLGDVQQTFWRPWWLERGIRCFGSPGDMPETRLLFKAKIGDAFTDDKLYWLNHYFKTQWKEENQPEVMVLSVPLNLTRQRALKEVKRLFDQHIVPKLVPAKPKYDLVTKDMHKQNIIDAMTVLMIRAARPSYKLWQVGVEAKISKTYSAKFDVKTTKRTVTNSEDLRTLEMMTSRKYRLGKWLAENAARGLFPLQTEPAHAVAFNPNEFNQIISETVRWEKREKTKMLAEADATKKRTNR
jgi:hypothetical protein